MTDSGATETAYIHTTTHNYISRQATLEGARQLELKGRNIIEPSVHFHANLAPIRVGRYCRFDPGVVVTPPPLQQLNDDSSTDQQHITIKIGSKTCFEESCTIQAAAVGSMCWIGKNVTLGPRVIVKDCVVVAPNTVVPADTVVPPFSHLRRNDNILVRTELPPSAAAELEEKAVDGYQEFILAQQQVDNKKAPVLAGN